MKKFALAGAISCALLLTPNFASASLTFLEGLDINVGAGTLNVDLYTSDKTVSGATSYNITALTGQFIENGVPPVTFTTITGWWV